MFEVGCNTLLQQAQAAQAYGLSVTTDIVYNT